MKRSVFLVGAFVLAASLSTSAYAWPFRCNRCPPAAAQPAPIQYAPVPYAAVPSVPANNPAATAQAGQGQGYRTYSYQPSYQPAMGGYAPMPSRSGGGYRPSAGFRDAGSKVRGEF